MRDIANSPEDFKNLTEEQQNILKNWINKNLSKIKSINKHYSSYGLKHYFENDGGFYIHNGQFKGAMLECGFLADKQGINWCFNVSKKSIMVMEKRGVYSI